MRAIKSTNSRQSGFILIAVSLALAVLAAMTLSSSQFAGNNTLDVLLARQQLDQLAEAALTRSRLQWRSDNCNSYTVFTNESLNAPGSGSFSASTNPAGGSPVNIDITVSNGNYSRNIQISGETQYQWPDQNSVFSTASQGFDNSIRDGSQQSYNYGAADTLRLQEQLGKARPLIAFDLSTISTNVALISATLQLNILSNGNSSDVSATIYRLKRDWLEGSMNGAHDSDGSDWVEYDGDSEWNHNGGDYDNDAQAQLTIPAAYTGALEIDISGLARAWIRGSENNQGLIIIADSGTNSIEFASGEHASTAAHPVLSLNWRCPCGLSC